MYEGMTFETILNRMLSKVPRDVDKRQGSIIHDALAPAAAELAQMYIELQFMENRTYADTSTGIDLTRRCAERGINRKQATKAMRLGLFLNAENKPFNVPIGSRFSGDELNYVVIERISQGQFKIECETPGEFGNRYAGKLIPIEYIDELESAELMDILIPGEDTESDENLRKRYFDGLNSQAFGGNIADYKEKTHLLDGVGAVKVFPVWNGGGTVKLVMIDSSLNKPSKELVAQVQTAIDPVQNQGEGFGIAPIGHIVTVEGVTDVEISIETEITLLEGYTWEDIKPYFKEAIEGYFSELKKNWEASINIVVRISQIETRALDIQGILDIQRTKINGIAENLTLSNVEIPKLEEVMVV